MDNHSKISHPPALQNADKEDKNIIVPDPLPKEKCLQALAELRHSKWFAVTAANMPSCVECIRIVKDLSNRDPAWTVLTDWAIELLVERALFTAWMPLNPAASLMRVLEVCLCENEIKNKGGQAKTHIVYVLLVLH